MKTNDIRHTIETHDAEGNQMQISIRLNDECHNGHQDFSITGTIWEKGKARIDRNHICSGCIHDEIVKAHPELKIFVNLHLCDYSGIPMYAVENGFYHLKNGFNNTKKDDPKFPAEFSEYYRITPTQYAELSKSKNKLQYALKLRDLGILDQWNTEAKEAIAILESMTGKEFEIDSERTQYNTPTAEEVAAEVLRENEGYYTPEAEAKREEEKQAGYLKELEDDRDKVIGKATMEFEVKKQVLMIGGKEALESCIFYDHTKELAFNWLDYKQISKELIEKIKSEIQLPEGVKIVPHKKR